MGCRWAADAPAASWGSWVDRAVECGAGDGAEQEYGAGDADCDAADAGVVQHEGAVAAGQDEHGHALAAHALGGVAARDEGDSDGVWQPGRDHGVRELHEQLPHGGAQEPRPRVVGAQIQRHGGLRLAMAAPQSPDA